MAVVTKRKCRYEVPNHLKKICLTLFIWTPTFIISQCDLHTQIDADSEILREKIVINQSCVNAIKTKSPSVIWNEI